MFLTVIRQACFLNQLRVEHYVMKWRSDAQKIQLRISDYSVLCDYARQKKLIIGKFATPRGFKNLDFKRLNVLYRHTEKAWGIF